MYIEIGTIVTIIIIAFFVIWGIVDYSKNKEIERQQEEKRKREEENRKIEWKNQQERDKLKIEHREKEIMIIMNCTLERAKAIHQSLSDFILISDFDSSEHTGVKKIIIDEAINYQKYFDEKLLPIIQEKNYSITVKDIGFAKSYFYSKKFSLISEEDKLKMFSEYDYYQPHENVKVLLETIREDIACKITERSAMPMSENLDQEDFYDIVIAFVERFDFKFTEITPLNERWGEPYKYDYEMLESVWIQSLLSSQNKEDDDEDYFKYSELFFGAVHYDIKDYKNVIEKTSCLR